MEPEDGKSVAGGRVWSSQVWSTEKETLGRVGEGADGMGEMGDSWLPNNFRNLRKLDFATINPKRDIC